MQDLEINDMKVSREAINKLVIIAVRQVDGVCVNEESNNSSILSVLSASEDVTTDIALEGDKLRLGVHLCAEYGNPLPEIAEKVRISVADSVSTQLGLDVASIDVYVDNIQFGK